MIIDTEKIREAIKIVKDDIQKESTKLSNEIYMSHMISLITMEMVLNTLEKSAEDENDETITKTD